VAKRCGRRNVVSSKPSRSGGDAGRAASTLAASATVARQAVHHDTRCSAATSATLRVRTIRPIASRNRQVSRALAGTWTVDSVNDGPQPGVSHRNRRLIHTTR
jgi:hypothetical protein